MEEIPSWRKNEEKESPKVKLSAKEKTKASLAKISEFRKRLNIVFVFLPVILFWIIFGFIYLFGQLGLIRIESVPQEITPTTPYQVQFTEVGSDIFEISWETQEPTIGFIRYGESAYTMDLIGQNTEDSGGKKTKHVVRVDGLIEGETYYIEIHSDAKAYGEGGEALVVTMLD